MWCFLLSLLMKENYGKVAKMFLKSLTHKLFPNLMKSLHRENRSFEGKISHKKSSLRTICKEISTRIINEFPFCISIAQLIIIGLLYSMMMIKEEELFDCITKVYLLKEECLSILARCQSWSKVETWIVTTAAAAAYDIVYTYIPFLDFFSFL